MAVHEIGRSLLRGVFFVAWILLPGSPPAAAAPETPEDPSILTAGVTVERQLTVDDVHTYRAELDPGAWRFLVSQHGVDTVAEVVVSDGVRLGPFNSPAGRRGTEGFLVTLDAPGTVDVEIRPRSRSSFGRYTVAWESLAPAAPGERTPREQARVLAATAATEAALSYAAGAKGEARDHYRQALSDWRTAADPAGRARTLVALATLARSLGEPREAAELFRRAAPLWQALGDRENEATTLNRLGLTLDDLGESATAKQLFEEAITLWRESGDPEGEASARVNLCLALQRQGEFADARACYEDARALYRELHDPVRETAVLSNLAGVYWKLGDPDRALALYDEVLTRSRARGDAAREGRTLSNRARLFYELGEAEEALRDYGRALAVFRRLETTRSSRMEGVVLRSLGSTHLGLGELDRARTFLEQALVVRRAAGDRRGVAATLRDLGQTWARQEDWPKAFDAWAEALALSRELVDRRGEATVLKLIGEAHVVAGSPRRAVVELERVVELQREQGDRRQEAQALLELARARRRTGSPERALARLDQALDIFRAVRDRAEEMRTLEAKARTRRDLGRTAEALADTAAAVELLEDLRVRAGGLRQRSAFFAARRGVYELRVDLLVQCHRARPEAGYDRQAFAVSEQARSRALLDVIQAGGVAAGLDDDLRRRLRAAARRLAARTERQVEILGREHDDEAAAHAEREVHAALTELERARAEARRQNPTWAELIRGETLSAARVGELLDPGTLLVEIVLGEERGFLWAVTPGSFASFELPGRPEIEALARRAHADLSTLDLRTGRTSREALTELGRVLLDPLAEHLDAARRLVVVADGVLHYLPFAAFPRPGGDQPLVVSHEVVHLPSASALAVQRRRTSSAVATKTVAILADPVFDVLDPRLSVAGEPGEPEEPADVPARIRGDLDSLGRLAATGREAAAVAALVEPRERLVALGFDAHRERVLGGELAAYRYLHFATHGLVNSRHPELSGLVLSRLDADGLPRDGFLGMDDVYGLELSAELVVLSGCQTALGREIRGEGLVGLSHGFMVAGVPRVVASLWPVRDQATAELMTRFYRGVLEDARPPAAALAAAQRSIRQERRWADPYFWAAFVLLGDWR